MKSSVTGNMPSLLQADNTAKGLRELLEANSHFRVAAWPPPFDKTHHHLRLGDARDLSWIEEESVHLVVTSPPYFTLKSYRETEGQLGHIADYETFLTELDKVWQECARVLAPGGRICCVVGDVCIPRKEGGRHYVLPLHADIQVRSRWHGLDCLTPILWHKIANGATECAGNGAGFYGKPFQPGAIVKNDIEHILFLRKGGSYRSPSPVQKALSMLNKREMQTWFASFWHDVRGASTRTGHPAPFPVEIAERLVRMFSFAGDTVLDPFAGTASTCEAAVRSGRHSIGVEVDPVYFAMARRRMTASCSVRSICGPAEATLTAD
jgi:site-specific DNA-methyltransferase (adenine-specific)